MSAPEKLTIDTPEQIALEYPLAGAGSRFLALAIDSLVQALGFVLLVLLTLMVLVVGSTTGTRTTPWVLAIMILVGFFLYYGYFVLFESWWSGQTPGKRAIGIRVIAVSGRPLGTVDAFLRNLLRIVDQLPGMYAVGLLSIFLTERNQRLGDLAAGTVVIHDRPIERPSAPRALERTTRHGARALSAEEIAVVETFLSRRQSLEPYVRLQAARRIVARIGPRLHLSAADTADEERILQEIASEYRSG